MRDGRIYGRGAVDAKGQIVTALMASIALRDIGYEPSGRLIVESVVCEEPTGDGTLALCSQGWLADAAIVLEPTQSKVCYGHRGIVGLRYGLKGISGHAGVLAGSKNTIVQVGNLAIQLAKSLDGWDSPTDEAYGPPSINIGTIHGGQDIFSTPYGCELECGVRYAPGTYEDILTYIKGKVEANEDGHLYQSEVFSHYDAAEVPHASLLPKLLVECAAQAIPDITLATFPGGCDARHFTNRYGVPAVIFGPGDLKQAHRIDEYIDVMDLVKASQALALFITRWCES
jgi:acetylornithine deacetylase/succinyl-diaminopimelate desuccinylase-like protein